MKKPQANFVVEYKGARRKSQPKSNSIWGNVDLRDYADEDGSHEARIGKLGAQAVSPRQTSTDELPLNSAKAGNVQAKDGSRVGNAGDERTLDVAPTVGPEAPAEPERIEPLTEEATHEDGPSAPSPDNLSAPAAVPAKRATGRAARNVKRSPRPEPISRKASTKHGPKPLASLATPQTAGGDDREDLLLLERENRELRSLLIIKLRSDNALLRKRLGLD